MIKVPKTGGKFHGSYYLSPTKMVKFCNETFAMHILFKIHKPELSEISPER